MLGNQPTCSAYSLEALHTRGALRGSRLAVCRIGRCRPFPHGVINGRARAG
ncbi:membrane protein insertion efficiency factor YidD [Thermomonospora cellulosilytica]|uniref:membrane protein insertion efficiency factor YidD n=1 Tax=Thermomonospora cellulosilytica TaxID=1411118 RepID=UPI0024845E77|nr:membrane protein insertion efficiency factor YidD [Thermomonospora cellulosilytica]